MRIRNMLYMAAAAAIVGCGESAKAPAKAPVDTAKAPVVKHDTTKAKPDSAKPAPKPAPKVAPKHKTSH